MGQRKLQMKATFEPKHSLFSGIVDPLFWKRENSPGSSLYVLVITALTGGCGQIRITFTPNYESSFEDLKHVFGLQEESTIHGENMQTSHRNWDLRQCLVFMRP